MTFPYSAPLILSEKIGNNALAYDKRKQHFLTIPDCQIGNLSDVKIGKEVVFEEFEDGVLRSCVGLKHFIRLENTQVPITIFDNHNHALYFWYEALFSGMIEPGAELIHIDEHSDLWDNEHDIHAIQDPDFWKHSDDKKRQHLFEFTNFSCNVGNYIQPAIRDGLIGKMIRIENEYQLDEYMGYIPTKNSILNIDLDFFAPEMDFINIDKKVKMITNILPYVGCVTIATSPYFIEPWIALSILPRLFPHL